MKRCHVFICSLGVDVSLRREVVGRGTASSMTRPFHITAQKQHVRALCPPTPHRAIPLAGSNMAAEYIVLHNFLDLGMSSCICQILCSSNLPRAGNVRQAYRRSLSMMLAHDPRHCNRQKQIREQSLMRGVGWRGATQQARG